MHINLTDTHTNTQHNEWTYETRDLRLDLERLSTFYGQGNPVSGDKTGGSLLWLWCMELNCAVLAYWTLQHLNQTELNGAR